MNLKSLFKKSTPNPDVGKSDSFEKAISWIRNNKAPNGGIMVRHGTREASPEVTGYTISTLYQAGEKELAFELARWEASIQRSDGSFTAPGSRVPYTFDTAQVIRGFLAVVDDLPELKENLVRACNFVESQINKDGKVLSPSYDTWKLDDGGFFTEYANLYVLPPLLYAGQKLGDEKYRKAAIQGTNYFTRKKDPVDFKPELATISHIFGYMLEALVELGETELAKKGISQVLKIQTKEGAIPAYPGVSWVCSTGMAQLAISLYKLSYNEPADKAVTYLERLQNPSGGFYGSYGSGAKYFPNEEISWAVKFFLDAYMLRQMKSQNV